MSAETSKHLLNKNDPNEYAKLDRKRPRSLNTHNELQVIENSWEQEKCSSQGSAHQLVFQRTMLSSKSLYTSSIIQTEQVIFKNVSVYIHTNMHATLVKDKTINFKVSRERYLREFRVRKGNGGMIQLFYNHNFYYKKNLLCLHVSCLGSLYFPHQAVCFPHLCASFSSLSL